VDADLIKQLFGREAKLAEKSFLTFNCAIGHLFCIQIKRGIVLKAAFFFAPD